jgi:adenosine kinase
VKLDSFEKLRFRSLIAIGNPIVDISSNIEEDVIEKYGLKWGETVFANESNRGFFKELEKNKNVKYIPGGSIQNTLRTCAWCLGMEPGRDKTFKTFKITMLGATGKDSYRNKIIDALHFAGVKDLLECIPDKETSRCGVGICKKERCLLPEIRASNMINDDFILKNIEEIDNHDALLLEGYFIQERFEICLALCKRFKSNRKTVILTLSAVFMVQTYYDRFIELANFSDLIIANKAELEELAQEKGKENKDLFIKISKKLVRKKRLFVVTDGKKGVIVAKYDYDRGTMDFILRGFPKLVKLEDIVDLNGAGDAFLGGFLSQYMLGKSFEACCKAGNDVAGIIIRNIGCTFPKSYKINFAD